MRNVWPVALRLVHLDAFLQMCRRWIFVHHSLFRSFGVQIFSTKRYSLQHCKRVAVDFPAPKMEEKNIRKSSEVNVMGDDNNKKTKRTSIVVIFYGSSKMNGENGCFPSNPLDKSHNDTRIGIIGLLTAILHPAGFPRIHYERIYGQY